MTIAPTSLTNVAPVGGPGSVAFQRTRMLRLPRSPKVIARLVILGLFGGAPGGRLDRVGRLFLAIPGVAVLIVLADYVPYAGSSILLVAAIIAVTTWACSARTLRAQTLSLRNRDFVEAARVSGEGRLRIILVEVLPNLVPIVAASFLFTTLSAIGAYVALAFLGLAGSPTADPPASGTGARC